MENNVDASTIPLQQSPTWLKTFFTICGIAHILLALFSLAGIIIPLIVGGVFSGIAGNTSGTTEIFAIFSIFLKSSAASLVIYVVLAYGFLKMRKWVIPCVILQLLSSLLLSLFLAQNVLSRSNNT